MITQIQLEKSTKNWLAKSHINFGRLVILSLHQLTPLTERHLPIHIFWVDRKSNRELYRPRQNAFTASPSCSSAHSKCVRTAALHLARLTAALHLSLHNSEVITPFRPFLQLKIFRPGRRNFTADFQEEKNCQNGIKVDCFFESCRCCGVPQKYVVSVYEYFLASILTFLEGMIRL